jgi:hypothetical protein
MRGGGSPGHSHATPCSIPNGRRCSRTCPAPVTSTRTYIHDCTDRPPPWSSESPRPGGPAPWCGDLHNLAQALTVNSHFPAGPDRHGWVEFGTEPENRVRSAPGASWNRVRRPTVPKVKVGKARPPGCGAPVRIGDPEYGPASDLAVPFKSRIYDTVRQESDTPTEEDITMFRFMQRFGRDSKARWRGTGPMTRVRRRNCQLNCEALAGRQVLSWRAQPDVVVRPAARWL